MEVVTSRSSIDKEQSSVQRVQYSTSTSVSTSQNHEVQIVCRQTPDCDCPMFHSRRLLNKKTTNLDSSTVSGQNGNSSRSRGIGGAKTNTGEKNKHIRNSSQVLKDDKKKWSAKRKATENRTDKISAKDDDKKNSSTVSRHVSPLSPNVFVPSIQRTLNNSRIGFMNLKREVGSSQSSVNFDDADTFSEAETEIMVYDSDDDILFFPFSPTMSAGGQWLQQEIPLASTSAASGAAFRDNPQILLSSIRNNTTERASCQATPAAQEIKYKAEKQKCSKVKRKTSDAPGSEQIGKTDTRMHTRAFTRAQQLVSRLHNGSASVSLTMSMGTKEPFSSPVTIQGKQNKKWQSKSRRTETTANQVTSGGTFEEVTRTNKRKPFTVDTPEISLQVVPITRGLTMEEAIAASVACSYQAEEANEQKRIDVPIQMQMQTIATALIGSSTEQNDNPNRCPECLKLFSTCWSVTRHLKRSCITKKPPKTVLPSLTGQNDNPKQCPKCLKLFSHSWSVARHLERSCITKKPPKTVLPSLTGQNDNPKQCPKCLKLFSHSWNVTRHLKGSCITKNTKTPTGQDGNPNQCPQCSQIFPVRWSLTRHLRIKHNTSGAIHCEVCRQPLGCKFELKRHMKQHTGMKYECPNCLKKFRRINSHNGFAVHRKICCPEQAPKIISPKEIPSDPTGSFECFYCKKKFLLRVQLKHHLGFEHDEH